MASSPLDHGLASLVNRRGNFSSNRFGDITQDDSGKEGSCSNDGKDLCEHTLTWESRVQLLQEN